VVLDSEDRYHTLSRHEILVLDRLALNARHCNWCGVSGCSATRAPNLLSSQRARTSTATPRSCSQLGATRIVPSRSRPRTPAARPPGEGGSVLLGLTPIPVRGGAVALLVFLAAATRQDRFAKLSLTWSLLQPIYSRAGAHIAAICTGFHCKSRVEAWVKRRLRCFVNSRSPVRVRPSAPVPYDLDG
jgi:hypothetical protein